MEDLQRLAINSSREKHRSGTMVPKRLKKRGESSSSALPYRNFEIVPTSEIGRKMQKAPASLSTVPVEALEIPLVWPMADSQGATSRVSSTSSPSEP